MSPRKAKVFWTPQERRRVTEHIAGKLVTPGFERGELLRAVSEAQCAVLPRERWRSLHNPRLFDAIGEEAVQLLKSWRAQVTPPVAQRPPLWDELLAAVADAVAARLEPRLAALEALVRHPPVVIEQRPPEPSLASPPKPRAPRILVVGTWGDIQRQLEQDFRGCLDVRFWDSKVSSHGLVTAARGADLVLLRTKNIRHMHASTLKDAGLQFEFVNGGYSQLKARLEDYYLQTEEAK